MVITINPISLSSQNIHLLDNNTISSAYHGNYGRAYKFTGAEGKYDIAIAAFDENDGSARFDMKLNGNAIGSLTLDDNLGYGGANSATLIENTVSRGIDLNRGDVLTINAFEHGSEHARFDYLEFIAVDF